MSVESIKAHALADYIICLAHHSNVFLSTAKLHKLLYLLQGWYLALSGGESLFDDDFEGWKNGPVLPSIYRRFGEVFSPLLAPIDIDNLHFETTDCNRSMIDEKDIDYIDYLFKIYGKLSAYQMELIIKEQEPWKRSRYGLSPLQAGNNIIPKHDILSYFQKLIK